ncbi:hypothetical protein [Actinoplanes sp. NPDC048796]|uniref:hypothetical protein n=1 Tax=Actinoplanes sp. NPDC048796 TaxID=3155640 RepID=UPI0033C35DC1
MTVDAINLCLQTRADYVEAPPIQAHFTYKIWVTIGPSATTADTCTVTGWATFRSSSATWNSPKQLRGCSAALRTGTVYDMAIMSTDTTATYFAPHGCITLDWDSGERWQQCYSGEGVRAN